MKTIAEIIFSIIEQAFILLGEILSAIFRLTPKRKTMYDADFISETEILSKNNNGFCLTGKRSLSIHDSYMHCLALGGSGSGKTTTILVPSIFNMAVGENSMIMHDPSGELYNNSASYLLSLGYDLKVLHYANTSLFLPNILFLCSLFLVVPCLILSMT